MFKNVMYLWYERIAKLILLMLACAFIGGASFASPSTEGIQTYQKNVHLSPEHKQKLADDITRYRNADNLWDALREEFTLPHYEDHPAVQEKIEWYMNNQDYLLRSASRAAPYLYYILQQVKKRHLPAELVLLPIIESGYNPFSLSNVGAAGIWQLMPGTASGLGVKRDVWYDGRRDVIASTRAALNYLDYLQSFFDGNWLYAMAAYNTGEGNVLSAIKKNIRLGEDTDFWSLPVAQQTKDYVPSILALATIISHPDQYPIYFPPVRNAPYLAQVDVGTQINLQHAATLAGISYKKVTQLNPAFTKQATSTSSKGPSKLLLPIENIEQFSENFARSPLNRKINWLHYKIKSGDTIASLAKKFNTTPSAIRNLNQLQLSKNTLKHGSDILIPYKGQAPLELEEEPIRTVTSANATVLAANETAKSKKNNAVELSLEKTAAAQYTLQAGDTVYVVRAKDTLDNIAKRFRVDSKTLQAVNQLSSKKVATGKQLIIPTSLARNLAAQLAAQNVPAVNNLQPGDTVYMVRRGDTIEKIARKFKTTSAAIRVANLMNSNRVSEGEKLVVPTHSQA